MTPPLQSALNALVLPANLLAVHEHGKECKLLAFEDGHLFPLLVPAWALREIQKHQTHPAVAVVERKE